MTASGQGGLALGQQPLLRLAVLALQARDERRRAGDFAHSADALAAAPDLLPGLGLAALAAAEVHLGGVALGQVVRVQARSTDAGLEVVAVHAGEQAGVDDVVGVGLHDAALV